LSLQIVILFATNTNGLIKHSYGLIKKPNDTT
jgi:hypothetical protein